MSAPTLPVVRLSKIDAAPTARRWLVEGLWSEEAVGFVGGTPKSGKTWLALEIAVAVASGRPCLGRYAVSNPGPVLLFAAEDAPPDVRLRGAGLAKARGIDFERLAVGLIHQPVLRLDLDEDRRALASTVAQIQPRLLVLDPLVRLHRGDENSSAEISDLLGFLRQLQREHHVAVLLVHHIRKSGASQPGQALRGSGDLHAWGDSNLYLLRREQQVVLQAEHRAQPAPPPVALTLEGTPPRLVVRDLEASPELPDLERRVLESLAREPMTRGALRDLLRVRNESLGEVIERLEAAGRVVRLEGRLAVPVPVP